MNGTTMEEMQIQVDGFKVNLVSVPKVVVNIVVNNHLRKAIINIVILEELNSEFESKDVGFSETNIVDWIAFQFNSFQIRDSLIKILQRSYTI